LNYKAFALDQLDFNPRLIYGKDDRYEVNEYKNEDFIEKAHSVAIRISKRRLSQNREDENSLNFPLITLKRAIPQLCTNERFYDQYSVGDCSGFLIGLSTLVTAGHCMMTEVDCAKHFWVFDFKLGTTEFSKNNVYSCKKIITQKYIYSDKEVSDYAVIELDREVTNRQPLSFRKFGRINFNTPLLVIGHPMGLPMKITDGARVTGMNDIEKEHPFKSWWLKLNYFTANLDTYGGNSGSPVFNKDSGDVEGILVKGAEDFVFNQDLGCKESRHLSNASINSYEKVMRITKVPGI
jgi:hypothetical protein